MMKYFVISALAVLCFLVFAGVLPVQASKGSKKGKLFHMVASDQSKIVAICPDKEGEHRRRIWLENTRTVICDSRVDKPFKELNLSRFPAGETLVFRLDYRLEELMWPLSAQEIETINNLQYFFSPVPGEAGAVSYGVLIKSSDGEVFEQLDFGIKTEPLKQDMK